MMHLLIEKLKAVNEADSQRNVTGVWVNLCPPHSSDLEKQMNPFIRKEKLSPWLFHLGRTGHEKNLFFEILSPQNFRYLELPLDDVQRRSAPLGRASLGLWSSWLRSGGGVKRGIRDTGMVFKGLGLDETWKQLWLETGRGLRTEQGL